MNISGIRTYAGFYDYNEIKNSETRSQQIQMAKQAESEKSAAQEVTAQSGMDSEQQTFDSYDYAKQYEPDATYEMKGSDSNISLLDVDQILSDVQKDQVLQQYQFFVGESKAQTIGVTSGEMNLLDDFSL